MVSMGCPRVFFLIARFATNSTAAAFSILADKWQGVGLEVCWMDEECPEDLYYEALTRTNETDGTVYITFTPIEGATSVVRMFLHEGIRI
jgi:phage terminase large subunit-like protein